MFVIRFICLFVFFDNHLIMPLWDVHKLHDVRTHTDPFMFASTYEGWEYIGAAGINRRLPQRYNRESFLQICLFSWRYLDKLELE